MNLKLGRAIALLIPAALLAGAWGFQLIGGLVPCEMCHWQRWPLYAALAPAIFAFVPSLRTDFVRVLVALAGIGILVSGGIGFYHMGVEYHWWTGPTHCTSAGLPKGGDILKALMAQPLVLCDKPQWTLFGISLAGFNAIISIPGGLLTILLATKGRK